MFTRSLARIALDLVLEMISNNFSYIVFKQLVLIWIPFNRILANENMKNIGNWPIDFTKDGLLPK